MSERDGGLRRDLERIGFTADDIEWMASNPPGLTPVHAGDDPDSKYSVLRDRIRDALRRIDPHYPEMILGKSGAYVRAFVSDVVGYTIPNAELYACMTAMAEAVEKKAREQ